MSIFATILGGAIGAAFACLIGKPYRAWQAWWSWSAKKYLVLLVPINAVIFGGVTAALAAGLSAPLTSGGSVPIGVGILVGAIAGGAAGRYLLSLIPRTVTVDSKALGEWLLAGLIEHVRQQVTLHVKGLPEDPVIMRGRVANQALLAKQYLTALEWVACIEALENLAECIDTTTATRSRIQDACAAGRVALTIIILRVPLDRSDV